MRTSESVTPIVLATEAAVVGKALESARRFEEEAPPEGENGMYSGNETKTTMRVVIADDHAGFRRILSGFLRSQQGVEVVGEAADGQNAYRLTVQTRPDIVLIDLHCPKLDAVEAIRMIKSKHPETRVFVLATEPGAIYPHAVERADGIILKQAMRPGIMKIIADDRKKTRIITGIAS